MLNLRRISFCFLLFSLFSHFVLNEELNEVQISFAELLDNFWTWRLTESPAYGTEYGFHSMDDKIEEYTEQAFEAQVAKASEFLEETRNIAAERLNKQEQMSLEILEYNLKTFIDGYQYRKFGMYNFVTTIERPTDEWASVISNYRFESLEDYEKLIRRLRLLPVQIDQTIHLMRQAIANKTTAHSSALTGCLENLKQHTQDNYTLSPMYRPFLYLQIFLNKTAKTRLRDEARRVIQEYVIPAWTKFSNFIEFEYSKNTRPNISVSSLPGGLDYYKACLKWHTSLDLTPEEIHQLGLQSIDRMKEKIQNVMDAYGFNGTARAFVQFLNKKAIYFRDTQEDLLEEYRNMIEFIRTHLHKILISPPNISIIVLRSENPESPNARYSDPTIDQPHMAYFYANVFNPHTKPLYRTMATTLHEAEPGHHTQSSYAKVNNLPIFRRAIEFRKYNAIPFNWPFHSAYIEGWALYAEFLGEEMEVYPDKAFMFGRYSSEMLRNCRLVVDTGIHALGWTEEQAMKFLIEHSSMDERTLRKELTRYISWPGEALSYRIGFMKIMELRREAERLLGDNFDKREFHEEILLLGPCHLSMLEKHIKSWIESKLGTMTSSSTSLEVASDWSKVFELLLALATGYTML